MTKKIIILIIAALLLGGGGLYWFYGPSKPLIVIHPQIGPAVQAIYATGTVEPGVMLPIAAKLGARLASMAVDEGQRVEKNQLLAQMEDQDIQKTISELEARLNLAKADYDRRAALMKSGAVSKQSVDQARSDFQAAEAALARAKAEQNFLRLFAPEDGLVIKRDGEVGEFIPAGQPVFWLECCAPLRITAEVDEEDISLIKPGQNVLIRADAFPGQTFDGEVSAITPKGDPITRSYRVRIALTTQTPLMTGMTTETNIVIRKTDEAVLIPLTALHNNAIWIVENGKTRSLPVTIGARGPEAVEVIEPALGTNDLIIMDGSSDIKPGAAIQTQKQDWSPAS